jgi:hypothetical protein
MSTLTIINGILIVYVLPTFIAYVGIRWNHTYGKYKNCDMGGPDVFFTFCPLFNIIGMISSFPAFFMAMTRAKNSKQFSTDDIVRRLFMAPKNKG